MPASAVSPAISLAISLAISKLTAHAISKLTTQHTAQHTAQHTDKLPDQPSAHLPDRHANHKTLNAHPIIIYVFLTILNGNTKRRLFIDTSYEAL